MPATKHLYSQMPVILLLLYVKIWRIRNFSAANYSEQGVPKKCSKVPNVVTASILSVHANNKKTIL